MNIKTPQRVERAIWIGSGLLCLTVLLVSCFMN
jgi:hypothetical protein